MAGKLTPDRATALGRLGGLTTSSRTNSLERTTAARAAAFARFLDQVDPDGELSEQERIRRAKAAERAHLVRMALLSAEARTQRAESQAVAE